MADSVTDLLEEKEERDEDTILSVRIKCLQHHISRYQQKDFRVPDDKRPEPPCL